VAPVERVELVVEVSRELGGADVAGIAVDEGPSQEAEHERSMR
jgi:hypothetical protein